MKKRMRNMSNTRNIKRVHKQMHKKGCFFPLTNKFVPFSGKHVYRNGKLVGKVLKCACCDIHGIKHTYTVENDLASHHSEPCKNPLAVNGYSKKIYSLNRLIDIRNGFTCPKCGGSTFGTSRNFPSTDHFGHCNTHGCGFKWKRNFYINDNKYAVKKNNKQEKLTIKKYG